MTLPKVCRPIALAGVVSAMLAGSASAQTLVIRGLAPGGAAQLVQGGATVAGTADANGDATLQGGLSDPGDTRMAIFVDTCEQVRRVVLVPRDGAAPPAPEGCARAVVPGVFVVRPVSTIVVNLAGANPTVLLRQGPFDFRRTQRRGVEPPAGLMVFGGGGYSRLHEAFDLACGDVSECIGENSGVAFGGGVAFWFTPYAGIEASYVKPKRTLTEGAIANSLFRSTLEPHVLMFQAKLGVPAGRFRFYGQGGATWHRAAITNIQDSVDEIEDRVELRTNGWGWTFGGGAEAWLAPAVALYVEGGRAVLKGGGVETGGEGRLDERMTFALAGLRISLNR
jgi:opacity protein-like surface antigen